MDEQFDERALLTPEVVRELQERRTAPSLVRLTLHFAAFAFLIGCVTAASESVVASFFLSVLLALVWAGIFAPFHECTHRTAFRSRRGNTIGVWLTALPFMMCPSVYRTFHFEHHRYTQDPEKDPELMNDSRYANWPTGWRNWLIAASGVGLLQLKLAPLLGFSFKPESRWSEFAKWAHKIENRRQLVIESRVMLLIWVVFILACLSVIPNGGWLLFAAWFTHVFQALWISAEHTGLPLTGSIVERTRTVTSNPFVRFWLWNMNYHAEHHAWPGMPWHQLPRAHDQIREKLPSFVDSYSGLHNNVIHARLLPSCDTPANLNHR